MIHSAIISGSIEQALFRDENGLWLIEAPGKEPQPASHRDAAVFHNIALEVCHAAPDGMPINLEALNQKLTNEVKFIRALRGLLVGMDPDYCEDLRRKNLASANAILLANAHLIEGIQRRMFVPTNSQEWDCAGAVKIANSIQAACAVEIYRPIADRTVDRVMDALSSAVSEMHGAGVKSLSIREGLQKAGLVARITALVSARDVKGLKSLAFTLKQYPAIAELDSNARISIKVANAFIASIKQPRDTEVVAAAEAKRHFPVHAVEPVSESDLTYAVTAFFENWKRRRNRGQTNEFADLEAIHKEVDWIAKRLHAGELPRAEFALIQLVRRQDGRSDPNHLAMSLTNVAGHARKAKAFDFCFAILDAIDLMNARDAAAADIRAEALSELGRCDEALAVFEETMSRFPDNAVVRNGYGELLREIGQFDAARVVFEESMACFPDDAVVRNGYGELLREMGQFDAARVVFEESMARFPDDVFVRSGYGELLREMGQFDAARTVFEESMARFPNNAVVRSGYGELLREMGQFDAARAVFEESMARFPDNAVVRSGYGELLREMGQFDAARAVFEESMARFPDNAVVRNGYGELLREMGQFDAARAVFEESMERFPNNAVVRSGYGELLREMGQFDAARTVFEESMARFPDNAVVRNGYVQTLLLDRDFAAVESVIGNIEQKISRSDWISFHILVMSYLRKGEPEKALALFRSGEVGSPFPQIASYFRSGVVMALIALRRDAEARQVIADTPEQHGASKRALSILEAHAHGVAGDNEGTARILEGMNPESLNKDERSLVEALTQIYVLRNVPKANLAAANDNVMNLEVIVIFNALGRVQKMRRTA